MSSSDEREPTMSERQPDEPPFEHPLLEPMAPEDELGEGESLLVLVPRKPTQRTPPTAG